VWIGLFACTLIVSLSGGAPCQARTLTPIGSVPDADPSVGKLENSLLSILNGDRARSGLPPLVRDPSLARIARDHSRDMASRGVLSHNLPSSGGLKQRLSRAGYPVRKARENIARAGSIDQAEAALLRSPGHLQNIMATDVTRVGVGIARGRVSGEGDLYITQIFAEPVSLPQPELLRKEQVSRVDEARRSSGSRPVRVDPVFEKVAARLLNSLEFPFRTQDLQRLLDDAKKQIPRGSVPGVSRMSLDIQLAQDLKDIKISEELQRAGASVMGAAVREFHQERGQPVVVLLTLIGSR
jgi:uncharacterized protein YkwD